MGLEASVGRILVVSPFVPFPPDRGHRVRIFYLMRQLCTHFRVGLVTQCFTMAEREAVSHLREHLPQLEVVRAVMSPAHRSLFTRLASSMVSRAAALMGTMPREPFYHSSPALLAEVTRTLEEWPADLVQAEYWFTRWAIPRGSWAVWVDSIDLHWVRVERQHIWERWPLRLVGRREARLIMRHELDAYASSHGVVAINPVEAQILKTHLPRVPIQVVPLSCAIPPHPPWRPGGRHVLFLGALDYEPNRDALRVLWRAMGEVRRTMPDTRLVVVGRGVGGLPQGPWVDYRGHVRDLHEVVGDVGAAAAPLRMGSGTSVKVPTLLGLGLPLVASPRAVEGLPLEEGVHYLGASTEEEVARQLGRLLSDPGFAQALSRRGYQRAREAFDWARTAARTVETYVEGVLKRAKAGDVAGHGAVGEFP